jgi:hypothetical protein
VLAGEFDGDLLGHSRELSEGLTRMRRVDRVRDPAPVDGTEAGPSRLLESGVELPTHPQFVTKHSEQEVPVDLRRLPAKLGEIPEKVRVAGAPSASKPDKPQQIPDLDGVDLHWRCGKEEDAARPRFHRREELE